MLLAQNLDDIQADAFPGNKIPINVAGIFENALPYVFGAAGIALLVYMVLGGLQMMTSRGDPKAAQSAQAKITNALIGFVVVIFAYFFVQLFGQIFGIQNTLFGQIFK